MKKTSLLAVIMFSFFIWNLTLWAGFSQEFQDAYRFAYNNKITTINNIENADMNWWLTRIAMAKMLSQYAINILWKTPDTWRKANFSDVSTQLDEQYNDWVTLAYQLWIMWIWIDKFRPFDSVTRAEFGTALSRVLFWNIYNQEWSNYYSKHLAALKIAGIMTKIDTPNQKEIRWYVMIMLMRSDNWNWNGSSNNDNPVIKPNTNNNTWTNTTKTWNVVTTWSTTSSWWGWWGWWWGWWSTTTSKYTVTRVDRDWATLEVDKDVPSGTMPTYNGITPLHRIDDIYVQIFSWRKPEVWPIYADTTYKGQLTSLLWDKENRLNILLIGYWGDGWEWSDLVSEAVILTSWDLDTNDVILVSLPFIKMYEKTPNDLAQSIKSRVSSVLWIDIWHYATMDFRAFKEAIDILWWIDIYVDEAINDTQYPNDLSFTSNGMQYKRNAAYWYSPFVVSAWRQHLNWEDTLKYVRSINTTSDSDRAYRQQKVLQAVKNKVQADWFNISQAYNLYKLYAWKIDTDIYFWDAAWIVRNLKNINNISSFKNLTSSIYPSLKTYTYFDWTFDAISQDINLKSFSIEWISANWKKFSSTSAGVITQFKVSIWNSNYQWDMGCDLDSSNNIHCNTASHNLSNLEVLAWNNENILLSIENTPLIKYWVNESYYINIVWEYSDGTSANFRIPLTKTELYECENSSDYEACQYYYNRQCWWTSFSNELQNAYNWTYQNWMTSDSSIGEACIYANITRAELAQMLAGFAKNIQWMVPDTTQSCNFTDISWVSSNLRSWIIEACQLGIMWQGTTKFNPYSKVSRAEFWTYISRMIWGSQYEWGTPYYANHLNALKEAWILDSITNPETTMEIKWYVMITLLKAANGSYGNCDDPMNVIVCTVEEASWIYEQCPIACRVDCDDPWTVIACTTNSEECPLVCRQGGDNPENPDNPDNPEPNGNLDISVNSYSDWRKLIVWWVSDMDTLRFVSNEEITVNKITLERYWYSAWSDVVKVWLEDQDWNFVTDEKTIDDNDHVTLSIKKDYKTLDWTQNLTVVVELSANATNWWTMWFKVISVESSALNIEIDNSNVHTYDIVSYEWSTLEVTNSLSDANYIYDESESYKIASIKLRAPATSAALVNWFTFTNKWDFNINLLDDVLLEVNWESENVSYSIKNWEIISSFDSVEIPAKASATFDFYGTLSGLTEFWKYIQLSIEESSDIKATEKKTWTRMLADLENITWPKLYFNQETDPGDNPGDNPGDIPDDNPGDNPGDEDPEDTEDCAYIKVDSWISYCFNITKVSGSTFWVSIKGNAEGVYWCSIMWEDGTNIWVFNSCSYNEFTILPSSGTHDFRIKLKYDGKEYSREVTYDLTNWVFVWN